MDVHHRHQNIDGHRIFYREAGPAAGPVVVLLHGFPSSSHMYRRLIPALADRYHVVAPDYPGSGYSDAPAVTDFPYSFDNVTTVVEKLLTTLGIDRFALYVQDFGAPVGYRLALRHPERVTAIVTQNGNAYLEGLGPDVKEMLTGARARDHEILRTVISQESVKGMYLAGEPDPSLVSPDTWVLDQALLTRPGADEIALAMLADYPSNLELYPAFQEYFRTSRPPLLAVWGANDPIFVADGARAYQKDLPNAHLHLLDAGHFALESRFHEIASLMREFLARTI